MNRTIIYQTGAKDDGIRVAQFLRRKSYSRQNLAQLKKYDDRTLLNGSTCALNDRISSGDTLEVRIKEKEASDNIPPTALPFPIVYEDEDILVVDKPAGLPIHPSIDNRYYSLANAVMYYYRDGGGFVFRCCNRLDRDTSGLAVIARHSVSASSLGSMVKAAAEKSCSASGFVMEREYLAVVCGTVAPASGTIAAPLSRKTSVQTCGTEFRADSSGASVHSVMKSNSLPLSERMAEWQVDFQNGKHAVTHYRLLEVKNGYSLVSVLLETGRTHQIRVHMAFAGFPLAGDYLYNPVCRCVARQRYVELPTTLIQDYAGTRESVKIPYTAVPENINGISRQALHAYRLRFPHPVTGEPMEFFSPIPEDMQRFGFCAFTSDG